MTLDGKIDNQDFLNNKEIKEIRELNNLKKEIRDSFGDVWEEAGKEILKHKDKVTLLVEKIKAKISTYIAPVINNEKESIKNQINAIKILQQYLVSCCNLVEEKWKWSFYTNKLKTVDWEFWVNTALAIRWKLNKVWYFKNTDWTASWKKFDGKITEEILDYLLKNDISAAPTSNEWVRDWWDKKPTEQFTEKFLKDFNTTETNKYVKLQKKPNSNFYELAAVDKKMIQITADGQTTEVKTREIATGIIKVEFNETTQEVTLTQKDKKDKIIYKIVDEKAEPIPTQPEKEKMTPKIFESTLWDSFDSEINNDKNLYNVLWYINHLWYKINFAKANTEGLFNIKISKDWKSESSDFQPNTAVISVKNFLKSEKIINFVNNYWFNEAIKQLKTDEELKEESDNKAKNEKLSKYWKNLNLDAIGDYFDRDKKWRTWDAPNLADMFEWLTIPTKKWDSIPVTKIGNAKVENDSIYINTKTWDQNPDYYEIIIDRNGDIKSNKLSKILNGKKINTLKKEEANKKAQEQLKQQEIDAKNNAKEISSNTNTKDVTDILKWNLLKIEGKVYHIPQTEGNTSNKFTLTDYDSPNNKLYIYTNNKQSKYIITKNNDLKNFDEHKKEDWEIVIVEK